MRDVFTMGARPIALLNALRFGDADHEKTPHLMNGVVAGIGGYGNCIGIPTVGGEVNFHPSYNGNILVNAMAVGLADSDKIFYSAATGAGNPVIYVGAKTGRDGIHGATMASAEFSEETESKRPTVQVGDPFTGKLLMEACLELMAANAVLSIQDMGAAGLTSSSVEMASKGGLGMEMDLDLVPVREDRMSAYEIMLSESQERMLMVIDPAQTETARAIFDKWDLDFMPIGVVTDTGRLVLKKDGDIACDIPLAPLVDDAPEYDRPHGEIAPKENLSDGALSTDKTVGTILTDLMASSDLASRRWVYEQYDRDVMADTVAGPGGDAALVRVHGTDKAVAISTDCTPRYVHADPYEGGKQAVAEAYRNICAIGATPKAVTNNLNFGNPERPEIMAQIVGSVKGMGDACTALGTPVVSGNVSLYNETDGEAIFPCPVIGMVGVMDDYRTAIGNKLTAADEALYIIGDNGNPQLGASLIAAYCGVAEAYAPPQVDLEKEAKHGLFMQDLIAKGCLSAAHDLSDGGLAVAATEMALGTAFGIAFSEALSVADAFGEAQARYLVATSNPAALEAAAEAQNIPLRRIGMTTSVSDLQFADGETISLVDIAHAYEATLPQVAAR